jgi:hypothetical protein
MMEAPNVQRKSIEVRAWRIQNLGFDFTYNKFPSKPAKGTCGAVGNVERNHYLVSKPTFAIIYQYTLDIKPQPKDVRTRHRILYPLLQHRAELSRAAADYRNNLVAAISLLRDNAIK